MQLFLNSSPVKKREMLIARDKCDTKWEPKQSRHNSRGCTPHPVLNAVQASLLTCTCTCGSILGKQQLLLLMRSYLWESNNVLLEIPSNLEPRSWSAGPGQQTKLRLTHLQGWMDGGFFSPWSSPLVTGAASPHRRSLSSSTALVS